MFLTASNIVHYLCAQGTISTASVVNNDFCILEVGRRNRNYMLLRKQEPGLFIKQVGSTDVMSVSTLEREAACYRLVQQNPVFQPMAALMPRLVAHDSTRHVLTTELLPEAESLNEFFQRKKQFPESMGRLLGESLALCHSLLQRHQLSAKDVESLPRQVPWILSFHQTHSHMTTQGGATAVLVPILAQYPEFYQNLERLKHGWRYDSIIHGDVKWDNTMVYRDHHGQEKLAMIDWELVDYGDAAWDVGGAFHAFLASWMYTMPFHTQADLSKLMAGAVCHLEQLFPAIRAFWSAYCEARGIVAEYRLPYLLRCIEFAAVRLIQTTFEHLTHTQTMSQMGAMLLQVSQNILSNPREAARELFGLSQEG
jgi:thiamine kinase-like enzyme